MWARLRTVTPPTCALTESSQTRFQPSASGFLSGISSGCRMNRLRKLTNRTQLFKPRVSSPNKTLLFYIQDRKTSQNISFLCVIIHSSAETCLFCVSPGVYNRFV